MAAICEHS